MCEVARATRDSVAKGRNPQFSLEMATAMLFVEHGLDQIRQLPDDFDAHAQVVGASAGAGHAARPRPTPRNGRATCRARSSRITRWPCWPPK
ncbi:hypothetical protein LP419_25575 [Massilia sp. H-1]|nr:hypothetical protein LP419_25575 [Massilia sp. H-1]